MTEHEQNLRDLAAMFALTGLLQRDGKGEDIIHAAFVLADEFMQARAPQDGIAALKPKRKEPK